MKENNLIFPSHQEIFSTTWNERGVLGFLVEEENVDETLKNATVTITEGLADVDG